MILPAVFGLVMIVAILWEAFETIVLPRRVTRRLRITVLFYRCTWRPWRAFARLLHSSKRRESFLGYYGPLSLAVSFYLLGRASDFGLWHAVLQRLARDPTHPLFRTCSYLSGTTFFTLGIGDVTPRTPSSEC